MPARTLPLAQDPFRGADPSPMKVLRVVYGGDTFCRADVQPDTAAATGRQTLVTVPPGIVVYDVGWRVLESFTNGAGVALTVDTDLAQFATVAQVGATDAADAHIQLMSRLNYLGDSDGTFASTGLGNVATKTSEIVDTGEASIVIQANKAAVSLDAGSMEVYVFYFDDPAGAGT